MFHCLIAITVVAAVVAAVAVCYLCSEINSAKNRSAAAGVAASLSDN